MSVKNAIVALGGGPSPVINSSLLGIVEACRDSGKVGTLLAARHGIEGVLLENLVDLSKQNPAELARLGDSPSSGAIGTCRYKLAKGASEDYGRIVDVIAAHNVGYFFVIGGNDSMDTAHKVDLLAKERGLELVVAGVPKTIDNDIGDGARTLIDHTPGFGSVARYWAMLIRDIEEENRGMCVSEPVAVVQAMGRKSGFITAAARLADPERELPLQLYFAESGLGMEQLEENVHRSVRERGRCIVVVNEGFDVGDIGAAKDGFGHVEYGASGMSASQMIVNFLNGRGLPARGLATGQLPGVLQRSTSVFRSVVDVREAREVARYAADMAFSGVSGHMGTILRDYTAAEYRAYYDKVPLEVIANSERFLPPEWIAPDRIDVTDAFIDYALPLIGEEMCPVPLKGGLQAFARLDLAPVGKKCAAYVPVNFRK